MTSTIKVDNIQKVSDASNIIKKCSATTTVGSGAGNTVVVCGATVTIGRCGGTVALASGASQTGFGRTGTVDWQTSSIKTGDFTAVNGEGYFINTTSGAVTMTMPSGSAGAIVSIGLAADSYIVTFEKFKDELKIGRSFQFAANKAVGDAWKTILIADFVSISAAFLLYILAIGPIKGFALALGIATIFDLLFTRIYTRNAVPLISNITNNPRLCFPIKEKDLQNV